MNDDELITVLREQRGKVVMTIPVEQIISRGRTVRARRRVPVVASAVGVAAAAAAVAAGVALPAGHPAVRPSGAGAPAASDSASPPSVRLAAWTVTRQADGSIKVTFRQVSDPAGLQQTLRADGVPASVTFTGQQNTACQPYHVSASQAFWPYGSRPGPLDGSAFINHPEGAYTTPYAFVINPSALPSGVGLQIWTSGTSGAADNFQLHVTLVKTSPQCTGSTSS
jgi:hypothetical protein